MGAKTIGKELNHGFAGNFARTPDMLIVTRSAGADIEFGSVLIPGTNAGQVKKADGTVTSSNIVGIAGAEVKSAYDYSNQGAGLYKTNEAVAVFQRGSINVICANGAPALGGTVYVAKTTLAFTGAKAGDIFAGTPSGTADTDYVVMSNAQWGGTKDANGVAELVILERKNA